MDTQVDVAAILRKIENRVNKKKPIVGLFALGREMIETAKDFLRDPNPRTWREFVQIEKRYLDLATSERPFESSRPLVQYANDFKRAMGKGGPLHEGGAATVGNVINSSWNPAHRPERGFVYGFWTPERPKLVKIGSTSKHPQDRLAEFAKRY